MQEWKSPYVRYGIAALFVAIALGLSLLFQRLLPFGFLVFFFHAVMLSGWFGRTGPGLFAAVISMPLAAFFFIPPYRVFAVELEGLAYAVLFLLSALGASRLGSTQERWKAQLDELSGRVGRDIAESRRALEKMQEARTGLAHLSRLTTVAELASSIAHEINQPISAIATNASAAARWLEQRPVNLEGAEEALQDIVRDANRAAEVLGRIRSLLKKDPAPMVDIDINEVVREVLELTRIEMDSRSTAVATELAGGMPMIRGDRVGLQQVLLNLIMNSLDAMSAVQDRPRRLVIKSFRRADGVQVQVQDTGGAWSGDDEAIFDPFFTTRNDGIGMGLAISRSIVETHGGRLWAERAVPHGAILSFTLPAPAERE